jgi:hypothetical protein
MDDKKTLNPKDARGKRKAPLRLMPGAASAWCSAALAHGAEQYGEFNWREHDVELSVYLEAIKRHIDAMMDGEWLDPKSGLPHITHVMAGAAIVIDADSIGILIYDLPPPGGASDAQKAVAEWMVANDVTSLPREQWPV